jgi:hypothetical protein
MKRKAASRASIGQGAAAGESARCKQLRTVFTRAVDIASSSVDDGDISAAFGDLKSKFGNSLQKALVNTLGKVHKEIDAGFDAVCQKHDAMSFLTNLDMESSASSSSPKSGDSEKESDPNIVFKMKMAETEKLKETILRIQEAIVESEAKKASLHEQIDQQLRNLEEEKSKLVEVAQDIVKI